MTPADPAAARWRFREIVARAEQQVLLHLERLRPQPGDGATATGTPPR
jgi:hypothetical protein